MWSLPWFCEVRWTLHRRWHRWHSCLSVPPCNPSSVSRCGCSLPPSWSPSCVSLCIDRTAVSGIRRNHRWLQTRLASDLPKQAGPMSPLLDLRGRFCERSPVSSNSQPNLRASCTAVPSKAVWCISFLGMQPTFTHVPPRPNHQTRAHYQQPVDI